MRLPRPDLPTLGLVAALTAGLGAVAAIAVVVIGVFNVSARDGHWPGVSWLFHTTFKSSAAFRAAPETAVPEDLDSAAMVALGAGHYMSACATCHGAPGVARSATIRAMLPTPPSLTGTADKFSATELHWIVHNGIKMTGMPAWPAERSDDVWPVVAFLRALPRIDAADYARLTSSEQGSCTVCHGQNGVSDNPHIPRLDILSEAYIARSLMAYRDGTRDSGIMAQAASRLSDETIGTLAKTFASVAPDGAATSRTDLFETGRKLAYAEDGSHSVPACRACHGPWDQPLNPQFPSLAGQKAPYLRQQLTLWREGNRGGGPAAELMFRAARDLTDAEIDALVAYYTALDPARLDAVADPL